MGAQRVACAKSERIMLIRERLPYLLADFEHYEPIDRYQVNKGDFIEVAARILPKGWTLQQKGFWCHCSPPQLTLPPQGWKIHLSAILGNSSAILATAARLLVKRGIAFKFVSDKYLLFMSNGKRWPRGSSGKFITIYPACTEECGQLLDLLYHSMLGYRGPYILSDRRYRDCGILYYRYGGIQPWRRLDVSGRPVSIMQGTDDQFMDDERVPYFRIPDGMSDPFQSESEHSEEGEAGTLGQGRYKIESAVSLSNTGGVYVALDQESGQKVIIKEARPFTNISPRGTDAVWVLKKEHRLLSMLEDLRIAPRPLDFFKDWEHYYLVEELIKGKILRRFVVEYTPCLRTRHTRESLEKAYECYRKLFKRIAEVLGSIHDRRIVFSDISHYNVIVRNDDPEDVFFIDFEGAYEEDVDVPTLIFTPGFTTLEAQEEGAVRLEDDYYGLGALMLAGLLPMNALLNLDANAFKPFLRALKRDLGLPKPIARSIGRLLKLNRSERATPKETAEVLSSNLAVGPTGNGSHEFDHLDCGATMERILSYIHSSADFDRTDKLFPADPVLFDTNPLGIAHGACGVAYAIHKITGVVPEKVVDWILQREIGLEHYSPGLYQGLCGIAWVLLELGLRQRAEEIMALARTHHLLWRSPDLFHGTAGLGMAHLHFFLETGKEEYLSIAKKAGEVLLESRKEEDGKIWWASPEGISCGLAHGVSGVSLYLLYLYLATGDERYLEAGRQGLDFVLGKSVRTFDNGMTWWAKEDERTSHTPYWRWGSSGVGLVLLRYLQAAPDQKYRSAIEEILPDADRKYAIFPGRFFGLSGIAEYHLDLADWSENPEAHLQRARKALSGALLFRLKREQGIAFPGENLFRVSCDFGTGSAGVALTMHRLLQRAKPDFMLDQLLRPAGIVAASGFSTRSEAAALSPAPASTSP